ncbi:unnamed protein product [Echinostoma caproni]|uniref:C2H2-type domain-containing protein n=1 Tax=Echinostoma caproni TaxID=27848 RepID=A0A183A7P3_9TREM|nr:unnamed protein product [Echinostoma caproni]
MVCDYLFCGTCFLNFRLSDITLFIEHKKNDCVAANTSSGSGRPSPDNLMANLLECVQCFRKFPTAWPLLMHVQVEHQLLFANAFRQASFNPRDDPVPAVSATSSEERNLDLGQNIVPYGLSLDDPGSNVSVSSNIVSNGATAVVTATPAIPHLVTIGTQTNMSWFRTQSRLVRKRALCCASAIETDAPCTDGDCPEAERMCQCSNTQASDPMCPCRCFCSQSELKTITCPPCVAGPELQNNQFSDPTMNCYTHSRPMDSLTQLGSNTPACCIQSNSLDCCSNKLVPSASQSMVVPCCPCPPAKRASMRSSEAQTDFDPEFSGPDYADIAMLLATPDRDSEYQQEVGSLSNVVDPSNWSQNPTEPNLNTSEMSHSQIVPTLNPLTNEVNYTHPSQPDQPSIPSAPAQLPQSAPTESTTTTACVIPRKQVDWLSSAQHVPSEEVMTLDQPYTLTTSTALHISPQETTLTRSVSHQFVCSECGNQYRQKVHLRKHIMTQHTRQKPYRCPSCNYTTVEKSHLTVHVRTHTGERPFVCRECDYASAQNCTLKAHYIRKHLNSRIFCSKCDEPFYTELERANHERLCLGNRVYPSTMLPVSLASMTNTSKTNGIKASSSPSRDANALL